MRTFFVSNDEAFAAGYIDDLRKFGRPNARLIPPQILGVNGHGTKMATVAAGKLNGIAPNADLYLMKIQGQWNSGRTAPSDKDKAGKIHARALVTVFDEIQRDVIARLDANKDTKSVINISWGEYFIVNEGLLWLD